METLIETVHHKGAAAESRSESWFMCCGLNPDLTLSLGEVYSAVQCLNRSRRDELKWKSGD